MRFFSKVAASRFVFSDGTEVFFMRGFADITKENFPGEFRGENKEDPRIGQPRYQVYQQELKNILGKNPMIYVAPAAGIGKIVIEAEPEVAIPAKTEAQIALEDAQLKNVPGKVQQETGAIGPGAGLPTDVNISTVDASLKAAMFAGDGGGEVMTGAENATLTPVQQRLAEIRSGAAQSVSR